MAELDSDMAKYDVALGLVAGYTETLRLEGEELAKDRDLLVNQVRDWRTEARNLERNVDTLNSRKHDWDDQLATLEFEIAKARETKAEAEKPVAGLGEKIAALTEEVISLEKQRDELAETVSEGVANHLKAESSSEEKVRLAGIDLQQLKDAYRLERKQQDLERAELANRIIAADKRDQNLRIRERKVTDGERFIQENANLLEL